MVTIELPACNKHTRDIRLTMCVWWMSLKSDLTLNVDCHFWQQRYTCVVVVVFWQICDAEKSSLEEDDAEKAAAEEAGEEEVDNKDTENVDGQRRDDTSANVGITTKSASHLIDHNVWLMTTTCCISLPVSEWSQSEEEEEE